MEAVEIFAAKQFRYVKNFPIPSPQPNEVLIKVKAVGICGTDVEVLEGHMGYFTSGMAKYPVVPGHEWVGVVEALGENVKDFSVGDSVVGETIIPCWNCADCNETENYQRCSKRMETGIMNKHGAFAEYLTYPARTLHKISDKIPAKSGCLIEPLSVAFSAVKNTVKKGDVVIIIGDGPIGLFLLMVSKIWGAKSVIVVGGIENRLAKAKELGADAIYDAVKGGANASQEIQEIVKKLDGNLADAVIEATGNPKAAELTLDLVKTGGCFRRKTRKFEFG
eukprot:TRINITY_DN746_c0_g1_i3.p1 TRINITY_DN746_c0_g1~~TRINITY_DN746_c0_g1_i3.p1  ORF type:complete len:279 (-),score=48.76 TRINITY_DN746_c0_g1_i3:249-1085(-)